PATGRIRVLREPYGPGRRIDSGIALGQEVTPYYDPILAKLVSYGATRQEALLRMQALLRDYTLLGVTTNRQFLLDVMTSAAFATGKPDRAFLDRLSAAGQRAVTVSDETLAVAALGDFLHRHGQFTHAPAATAAVAPGPASTTGATASAWKSGRR